MVSDGFVEKLIRRTDYEIIYDKCNEMFMDIRDSSAGEISNEEMVDIVNILRRKVLIERENPGHCVPRFDFKEEKIRAVIRVLKLLDGTEYSITISHLVDVFEWFIGQFCYEDIGVNRRIAHIPPNMINEIEIKPLSDKGGYLIDGVTDNWEHDILSYLDNHKFYEDLTEEPQEDSVMPKRESLSNALRVKVLDRDDYKCQMCGATVKDGAKLHIDHILPVSKGGKTVESNLQVLCSDCNHGKYNKDYLKHDKRKLVELEGK